MNTDIPEHYLPPASLPNHPAHGPTPSLTDKQAFDIANASKGLTLAESLTMAGIHAPTNEQRDDAARIHQKQRAIALCYARTCLLYHDPIAWLAWYESTTLPAHPSLCLVPDPGPVTKCIKIRGNREAG